MQLTVSQQADATIIIPVGRVDQATAEDFLQVLQAQLAGRNAASPPLLLDFSGIDYISSVGLRALMVSARQARASGCSIGIAALQPMVQEVFNIARFDLVIACFDTIESAMQTLTSCK